MAERRGMSATADQDWRGLWVPAALLLLFGVLAYVLWPRSTLAPASTRFVQEITVVQPPPPPPPPEPEEKIMAREPDIVTPSDTPRPVDAEPTPAEPPEAPSATSEAAGLDRPADAGSDSFSLAAGGGGGLFGRGGGGGGDGWGGLVEAHVRRALLRDVRTRAASGSLRVALQIETDGSFAGARLLSSTGNTRLDAAIADVLRRLTPLERQRPARFGADTFVTIDMRRIDVGSND
jgi:periplasmic protein TonB